MLASAYSRGTKFFAHNFYTVNGFVCNPSNELKSTENIPNSLKSTEWEKREKLQTFLHKLQKKLNLISEEDWNSLTLSKIKENGGSCFISKFSLYEMKCLGFKEAGNFKNPRKPVGYWENKENIKKFLLELQKNTTEDWNAITNSQIEFYGGSRLLNKYSLYELKCMGFPNGKNKFNKPIKPRGYWDNMENIKNFLKEIEIKLNLKTFKDWNSLTNKQIASYGGKTLLDKFTMYDIKSIGFPEGKSKFKIPMPKFSRKYWEKEENIHHFLSKLKQNYNLNTPEDWKLLTKKDIKKYSGNHIFEKYSMNELKSIGCPDGKLLFNEDNKRPIGFWNEKKNIDDFIIKLQKKLNLKTPEDWNLITSYQIKDNGGSFLLQKYSMYDIKLMGCPEGKFLFDSPIIHKNHGYWDCLDNIHEFLLLLKEKLNLVSPFDWNSLTQKQIQLYGGGSLLNKYSMNEIKSLGCPEGKNLFKTTKKQKFSKDYWDNHENILNFLNYLEIKLNIKSLNDWKRISIRQIRDNGGYGLCAKYSKDEILKFKLNDNDLLLFDHYSGRSSQRWLFLQVQKLFPNEEIVEDYFHSEISRKSGFHVQFDIFLTERNIAIEYHGKHHYEDIISNFAPVEMYKLRDIEKKNLCNEFGIQLVTVPYWWDNKLNSLRETLHLKLVSMDKNNDSYI